MYLFKITTLFTLLHLLSCASRTPINHKVIRKLAEDTTVQIFGVDGGSGSGSHIKLPDGTIVIITNKHVCQMKGPLYVVSTKSKFRIIRDIIKISSKHDLCLIQALPNAIPLKIGSEPILGDILYTLGHPRGEALNVAQGEYFDNRVIQIGYELNKDGSCDPGAKLMETTEPIVIKYCLVSRNAYSLSTPTYGGNSGSPVINEYGELVSIIFAGNTEIENLGFSIPLSYIKEFIK